MQDIKDKINDTYFMNYGEMQSMISHT